jgi:hypothetical protein
MGEISRLTFPSGASRRPARLALSHRGPSSDPAIQTSYRSRSMPAAERSVFPPAPAANFVKTCRTFTGRGPGWGGRTSTGMTGGGDGAQ